MPRLKLFLLGTPQVTIDDRPVAIQRRKAQALLFYLAETGQRQRRESLAALFWPESDHKRAHGSLRRHLSELSKALGSGWLDTDRETAGLHSAADFWLDVAVFQQSVAECQTDGHAEETVCHVCIEPLERAATLYRDDFLMGFTLPDCPDFDEWQFFRAEDLRQTLYDVLERLVDAYCQQGKEEAAIPYARRRLSLDPLHEPAHRRLMALYAATGQQAAALRQYRSCVQILEDEFGVPPGADTMTLHEQIRTGGFTGDGQGATTEEPALRTQRQQLPAQTTPFIGRERELAELGELCNSPDVRLITILGAGGMGKTRLALEVAQSQTDSYAQAVYFVSLVSVRTEAHLVSTIAEAIHFQFQADDRPPKQQLFGYLRQRRMLLVLDNFEHLLDCADLVNELLQSSPALEILVTSRQRLQLSGETIFALGSMDFPTWETPDDAVDYSAVRLFVQSAQRVRPRFELDAGNLQYVARICRLVGGMPLGIILAATWIEILSAAQIAGELTQGFDLLETQLRDLPERQRSMRTVLAHSWGRLAEAERAIFMRLSLFQGSFTRQAAHSVAGASLPNLVHLVNRSFVQRSSDDRYEIHELLRQYGAEQLAILGQTKAVGHDHAAYYLDFLHRRESTLAGHQQLDILAELETDFENVRAAWHWAVEQRDYDAVDTALEGLYRWFWMMRRDRQHEGLALLRYAKEEWTLPSGQDPPAVWGRILARIMEYQAPWLINAADAKKRIECALVIARRQDDPAEIAFCLWALGLAIVSELQALGLHENAQHAADAYAQSLALYRQLDDPFYLAQVLENLGQCYRFMRDVDQAIPLLQESLSIRRSLGDRFGLARSLREVGWATFLLGLDHRTEMAWQEAYEVRRVLDDRQGFLDSLFTLSLLALTKGDWQTAKELAEQEMVIASDIHNLFYPRWISLILEIAASMETAEQRFHAQPVSSLEDLNAFKVVLMHSLFANNAIGIRVNLHRSLELAVTDGEIAICLCIAARSLAAQGDMEMATQYLALAFRHPQVADSWVGQLPDIVDLRQKLQISLSPALFCDLWTQGQTLDIAVTAAELADWLDT